MIGIAAYFDGDAADDMYFPLYNRLNELFGDRLRWDYGPVIVQMLIGLHVAATVRAPATEKIGVVGHSRKDRCLSIDLLIPRRAYADRTRRQVKTHFIGCVRAAFARLKHRVVKVDPTCRVHEWESDFEGCLETFQSERITGRRHAPVKRDRTRVVKGSDSLPSRNEPAVSKIDRGLIRAAARGDLSDVLAALKNGANPNARDKYNLTALIWAARRGSWPVAEALLAAGADVEARDNCGRYFLHHAVLLDRLEFVHQAIAAGLPLNLLDGWGGTPLDRKQSDEMVVLLVERGASEVEGRARKRYEVLRECERQRMARFGETAAWRARLATLT